jgi:glycosyltransferase involved in cell wall biosynthesis
VSRVPGADDGDPAGTPALSVVIASVNGYRYIAACLDSLARQAGGGERAEVIVVEASGDDTASRIASEYPRVKVVPVSPPRPIPELRSLGVRQARADIVVTTEDHCLVAADWYEQILQAHRESRDAAIGGAVENGSCERLVDWAAYICEYGKFMRPFPARIETDLPGPNVSYKRWILEETSGDLLDRGVWENVLHARLAARGQTLRLDPSLIVYHAKRFGLAEFLGQRYHFGRSFAAGRVAGAPLATRVFFTVAAPLLPPLFLWRYARWVLGKRRFVGEFVKCLPLLALFAMTWSAGECLGYALGDGGSSLRVK